MNIVMWMVAGGALGWAGYAFLRFNEGRGLPVSMVIGAAGGFLGGNIVAPMFASAGAVPGDFSTAAMAFALLAAAVCLAIGNLVNNRWGV